MTPATGAILAGFFCLRYFGDFPLCFPRILSGLHERQIGIVRWHVVEQVLRVFEQIAVQPIRLARPGDFAIPESEAVLLLAVRGQFLEALLYLLPIADALLFGVACRRGMLLRIVLEHPWAGQTVSATVCNKALASVTATFQITLPGENHRPVRRAGRQRENEVRCQIAPSSFWR
jgi:hypothetical protein